MKKDLKINKSCKQIVTISAVALMSAALSLSGCGYKQSKAISKNASVKTSSTSENSVSTASKSEVKQKETEEVSNEKSNTESTEATSKSQEEIPEEKSAETSTETNAEEQENSSPQSEEEATAEVEPAEVQNDVSEPAPTESYEDPGDISGRLYIPDLGINVGLYMVSAYEEYAALQQEVCDAEDSAVYQYDFPGRPLIGDHCYQSFSSLYNSYIGMPVYIYGQEYVCVDNGWGVNTGETIIIGGSDVEDINDGLTVLFTCANTSDTYDVWCVTVAPV